MGQKVDPRGFRAGITKTWSAEWFAKSKSQSAQFFVEDIKIRNLVEETFKRAGIAKTVIRKTDKEGEVIIFTAKPALILGKEGAKLDSFTKLLQSKFGREFKVALKDVRLPELSAKIMSEFAAQQIEARMPFRRVAKSLLQKVMEKGATGIKVQVSGRLGGVDLSRTEKFSEGRVSLQTLRSDIDYHYTTALTKYGIIGIKVWISKGDILVKSKASASKEETPDVKKQTAMKKIMN